MKNPVIVLDYDPNWPGIFQTIHSRIANALGSIAARIEHVGSTAVPNLAAKPIIDIDVLLAPETELSSANDRLASIGYVYQGDLGIPGREAFLAPAGDPPHNLYACLPDSREFQRHLVFRDYLRSHPQDAKVYGDLKKSLAAQYRNDISAYVAGKSEFVAEIIGKATSDQDR
jgi:GrpB-like predicted nucleotidyltransferase (UPF0157 family)